jgi:hypothetical protein
MGNEAACRIDVNGETFDAKVLLETSELVVRGALKRKIVLRDAQNVEAAGGILTLHDGPDEIRIHLGDNAAKWAEKIRKPKPVAEKLGIRAGQTISISGTLDDAFVEDLRTRGADVSSRVRKNSDVIFFSVSRREDLQRLETLRGSLAPAGALWVVRPKGSAAISEADVMAAGRAAGLVDVKVVRFSDTHTAEKFVIPVTKR